MPELCELRAIDAEEVPAYARAFSAAFGAEPDAHALARVVSTTEADRVLVGTAADGSIAATAGAYSLDLSVPGGAPVACAGVTRVSVRADHRRRGVLRRMLERLHGQALDRGEAVAALWPSEVGIYGRFGYGPAAVCQDLEVLRAHARLRTGTDVAQVELIDTATARRLLPPLREAVRAQRPGLVSRSAAWWETVLDDDPPDARDGASPRFHAVLPERGYVIYRVHQRWTDGAPAGRVEISELQARDPGAAAALWALVTDLDLTDRVVARRRPLDEPLWHLLEDPGRLRITDHWGLHLRLLDVPAVLAARGYAGDDRLVLEIGDELLARNAGRFALNVEDGRATCRRVDEPADLVLDVRELASVVLGGSRVTSLQAAGRVRAATAGAALRLDRLLLTDLAPWQDGVF